MLLKISPIINTICDKNRCRLFFSQPESAKPYREKSRGKPSSASFISRTESSPHSNGNNDKQKDMDFICSVNDITNV